MERNYLQERTLGEIRMKDALILFVPGVFRLEASSAAIGAETAAFGA